MSITEKINGLNNSDLSKLSERIAALQKQAESITVKAAQSAKNTSDSSPGSGLTAEQLLNELAQAKRSAA